MSFWQDYLRTKGLLHSVSHALLTRLFTGKEGSDALESPGLPIFFPGIAVPWSAVPPRGAFSVGDARVLKSRQVLLVASVLENRFAATEAMVLVG